MHLPSLPRFIPVGPIRRRRLEQVAQLRAEDAKLQAARRARLAAKRAAARPSTVVKSTHLTSKPIHHQTMHTRPPHSTHLARTAAPLHTPTPPKITTPVTQSTPQRAMPTPAYSQPESAMPASPQTPIMPSAPSPTIANNVSRGRGTYANDFSRRNSYVAQLSR